MPSVIGKLVLIGIALGAVSANALNIYSGAMSFLAMGIKLPLSLRRAIVAVGFGAIGTVLAWNGLADSGEKYENFLLIIAYWIAPWLGVVLTDRWLRRGTVIDDIVEDRDYVNLAGPIAMLVGLVLSIWLFCDQYKYQGPIAKANNYAIGDLAPVVGFLLAAALYWVLFTAFKPATPTTRHAPEHHTAV